MDMLVLGRPETALGEHRLDVMSLILANHVAGFDFPVSATYL